MMSTQSVPTLTRDTSTTLSEQLRSYLHGQIESKQLQPGESVPSEHQLTRMFNVSRYTVRQALNQLVEEGFLYRRAGKGTYVKIPTIIQPFLSVTSFTDAMLHSGYHPSTVVLDLHTGQGDPAIREALQLAPDERVVKLVRVRYADAVAVALTTSYLPERLAGDLSRADLIAHSLYALLKERRDISPDISRMTLHAITAGPQEAALLRIRPHTALFSMIGAVIAQDGQVMEHVQALYRGDCLRFTAESALHTGAKGEIN